MMFNPAIRPSPEFAPACYWFWHTIPNPSEIEEQLGQIKNGGYQTFHIQARRAMPLSDYLSEDYLLAYEFAAKKAKSLGLRMGLYDEYGWQSGHGGGRAVAAGASPEQHLFWAQGTSSGAELTLEIGGITSSSEWGQEAMMSWHYHGSQPRWEDWHVPAVIIVKVDGSISLWDGPIELVGSESAVRITLSDVPAGARVLVLAASTCSSSRIPNLMDPRSVRNAIETSYEPYASKVGEYFGDPIDYVFFDQPHTNFYDWPTREGNPISSIPYSHPWWQNFQQEFGQNAAKILWKVINDDADAASARIKFYNHYGNWARETFLGPLKRWAHNNGLKLSGHEVLGHTAGWPLSGIFADWDLRVNFGADYFKVDAYRDITAVDAEGSQAQLSAKLGDSVARANGRAGTILEQYFGDDAKGDDFSGHWGLTPTELRRATIRNHAMGMKQLLFHAFYQSDGDDLEGQPFLNPRFDFPPGINFEPWFRDHHQTFAMESARLSAFIYTAEPIASVGIIYPLGAIQVKGLDCPEARFFSQICQRLWECGRGYQILPSNCPMEDQEKFTHVIDPQIAIKSEESAQNVIEALRDFPDEISFSYNLNTSQISAWAGKTESTYRIVLFNESAVDGCEVQIRLDTSLPRFMARHDLANAKTTALGVVPNRLSVVLAPNELLPLELLSEEISPTLSRKLTSDGQRLEGEWTLEIEGDTSRVQLDVGWEKQGYPTYSGEGIYRYLWHIDDPSTAKEILFPAVSCALKASLNGIEVGSAAHSPFVVTVPANKQQAGENRLEIAVTNSAANKYYGGNLHHRAPELSGICATPLVTLIERNDAKNDH